ncbi:hypothetical protein [Nonomuraea sp. NPDC049141]
MAPLSKLSAVPGEVGGGADDAVGGPNSRCHVLRPAVHAITQRAP